MLKRLVVIALLTGALYACSDDHPLADQSHKEVCLAIARQLHQKTIHNNTGRDTSIEQARLLQSYKDYDCTN